MPNAAMVLARSLAQTICDVPERCRVCHASTHPAIIVQDGDRYMVRACDVCAWQEVRC